MKRLFRLLKLSTTKDILVNTSGNYLNVGFSALYAFVLFRVMTPAEYGVLSVLFAITYLGANILDFGVTASIYSYLIPLLANREESLKFIKSNFLFQTLLSGIVLIILFILIQPIDRNFLKLHVPMSYFFWAFVSIPFFIWQNFALNILYATKKIVQANLYINIANVLKTLILFFLIFKGIANIENVIITLGVVGQIIFFIPLLTEQKHLIRQFLRSSIEREKIKLRYSLTFFSATQLFNLATRSDLFMLSFYLSKAEVGYYAAAQKIVLSILTSVNSVAQVLSPQFASVKSKGQVLSLVKKGLFYMGLPVGIFILAAVTPKSVYSLFFTDLYVKTDTITRALSLSYIFFALTLVPILFFLYTIKKPIHLLYINLIFFIIVILGCYLLIPIYGVFAPPAVFMIAFLAITAYTAFFFWREYEKL